MRYLILIALAAVPLAASGCVRGLAPVEPPQGAVITSFKAPLTTDFHETPVCTRKGVTSTYYVNFPLPLEASRLIWLDVAWSQAAIEKAARNGKLTSVEYADYEFLSVLGIVERFTVTAYGH